jgi:hypothetical protein
VNRRKGLRSTAGLKRSAPLQQGSPLARGKGLDRGATPLKRTAMPRSELKSGRPPVKPRRPQQTNAERVARHVVRARSGGTCEAACSAPATDWHHRRNRSQGGAWSAPNGMHLCREHHGWVTDHPVDGRALGWAVRSHEDPLSVPCLRRGEWVWLTPGGGVIPLSQDELAGLGGAA